jgi:hypothetical protein
VKSPKARLWLCECRARCQKNTFAWLKLDTEIPNFNVTPKSGYQLLCTQIWFRSVSKPENMRDPVVCLDCHKESKTEKRRVTTWDKTADKNFFLTENCGIHWKPERYNRNLNDEMCSFMLVLQQIGHFLAAPKNIAAAAVNWLRGPHTLCNSTWTIPQN